MIRGSGGGCLGRGLGRLRCRRAACFAARPALIRALNEQLLLDHIRSSGPYSRAELARVSGLSKPTVSLALANLERAGLIRLAGQRTGVPGRTALLYEVRPEAGFILGLDIGLRYLRGAVADLAGDVRARLSVPVRAATVGDRVAELVELADELCARVGITRAEVTATVVGSPGVYDPQRNLMALTGGLPGWDQPEAVAGLRAAFGPVAGDRERRGRGRARRARARRTGRRPTASRSCTSAPASAWAWCSAAGCTAACTGWPARSRSCRSAATRRPGPPGLASRPPARRPPTG